MDSCVLKATWHTFKVVSLAKFLTDDNTRVATSRLHPLGRLQPRQDEHTLGSPLRTPCHTTRPPQDRWGRARLRGRLVRETARLLSVCGVSLARSAVPGGTRHLRRVVLRSDATSASSP